VNVGGTLLADGIEGVRRWYELGPVRLHPSALVCPALLVAAARRLRERPGSVHALLLSVQLVHALQPDAGQATAFGLGALAVVAGTPLPARCRVPAVAHPALAAIDPTGLGRGGSVRRARDRRRRMIAAVAPGGSDRLVRSKNSERESESLDPFVLRIHGVEPRRHSKPAVLRPDQRRRPLLVWPEQDGNGS